MVFYGKNNCNTILYISSGIDTWSTKSNCKYLYEFSLKSAEKSNKNTPCTNRPVKCDICQPPLNIIWTCNLKAHYSSLHSHVEIPSYGIIEENEVISSLNKKQYKKAKRISNKISK